MGDNMNEREIINAGYHEYPKTKFDSDSVEKCYQKRFDDASGKKYFIDIKKYSDLVHPFTHEVYEGGYEYFVQLHNLDAEPINLQFFAGWNIDKVEEFVKDLFDTGRFSYYEKWDDN